MATKTLYHSELVKMGPTFVRVKSDVLQSKFKKDQRYVELEIDGATRNYNCENATCEEYFEGLKGREFTIVAEGTREEATISYLGEPIGEEEPTANPPPPRAPAGGGAPALAARASARAAAKPGGNRPPAKPPTGKGAASTKPPAGRSTVAPQRPPATAARPPATPTETPEQRLLRARLHANRVANVWLVAYSAAHFVREQVRLQFNQEIGEQQFQACVSTISIQLAKDGFIGQMPTGVLNVAPKHGPAGGGGAAGETQQSDNDGGTN